MIVVFYVAASRCRITANDREVLYRPRVSATEFTDTIIPFDMLVSKPHGVVLIHLVMSEGPLALSLTAVELGGGLICVGSQLD